MIGYAMPQVMGGNQSSETSKSMGISFCWVAREVYGEDNPNWLKFRHWMLNNSPIWFIKLYFNYGERFAKFIEDKPRIKSIIRGWMDNRIGVVA
jgi:transposase